MRTNAKFLPQASYMECVRSLFVTPAPMLIMSIGYVASFGVLAFASNSDSFATFAVLGVFSSSIRVVAFLYGAAYADLPEFDVLQASKVERIFAIAYFQFACLLGFSSVQVLGHSDPHSEAKDRAAKYVCGHRALHYPDCCAVRADIGNARILMASLLAGAAQNLIGRYRAVSEGIERRLAFQALARRDVLTELPN